METIQPDGKTTTRSTKAYYPNPGRISKKGTTSQINNSGGR